MMFKRVLHVNKYRCLAFHLGSLLILWSLAACAIPSSLTLEKLQQAITQGETAVGAQNRLLVVDVRKSSDFIDGHIKDALSTPLNMFADGDAPLYTNGFDEVSVLVEPSIPASWLAHILINQLVNDFMSTYEDSRIVFYGTTIADSIRAARVAEGIGYSQVSYLAGDYATWVSQYSALTEQYYAGVESVDEDEGSFIMKGYINNTNFENVSTQGTHHCIVYDGGSLHDNGLLQTTMAPFCFQELLVYLGASPEGNMADGIFYGDMDEWGSKFPNGEQLDYAVSWNGAEKFYTLDEIFEEKPSMFQPEPESFELVGIEARIGGTRDSNLNWNPGCIFCWYACVCGITSNAHSNEETWFADGGIYDVINLPDDLRNYYAGRYYPNMDILPGSGEPIQIKVTVTR
jgi:rhodanese-related sulfurtransferase